MSFFKDNIVSLIGLAITCCGLMVHVGVTKAEIDATKRELAEFKVEAKEKIRDAEQLSRVNAEKVSEKLDTLNRQVAVIISWVEDQKKARP